MMLNDSTGAGFESNYALENRAKQQRLRRQGLPTERLNLETWEAANQPMKYLYCDMIKPRKSTKKIEEALTLDHASDTVYYGILYLDMKTFEQESQSPDTATEKVKALQWLKDFRSQMVKIFVEECKKEYFLQANTDEWKTNLGSPIGFSSYKDLEEKTVDRVGEMVGEYDDILL